MQASLVFHNKISRNEAESRINHMYGDILTSSWLTLSVLPSLKVCKNQVKMNGEWFILNRKEDTKEHGRIGKSCKGRHFTLSACPELLYLWTVYSRFLYCS